MDQRCDHVQGDPVDGPKEAGIDTPAIPLTRRIHDRRFGLNPTVQVSTFGLRIVRLPGNATIRDWAR